jgi:hypothetical protein
MADTPAGCKTHAARTADTSQGQEEEILLDKKRKLSWEKKRKFSWTGRRNSPGLEEALFFARGGHSPLQEEDTLLCKRRTLSFARGEHSPLQEEDTLLC